MSEIDMLREIRPVPPPAEMEAMHMAARDRFVAGTRSRRGRHRWRLPVLAGGLTAAAAATAAIALVLSSGPGAAPGQQPTAGHAGTVITAAWTVRQSADGTVTIYLRQYANPGALQQTLRADGINAIVRPIPVTFQTIPLPRLAPGLAKQPSPWPAKRPLRVPRPVCMYASTNNAPAAVQQAVVTIGRRALPARFIIDPAAMPQGSALLLAFMSGAPRSFKNDNTGVMALIPVVLNNDTLPACVRNTKATSSFPPKAAPSVASSGA